ncbi:hypothetical protein OOK12_43930 [Streptomyces sp. NBC_00452]|uniref:hypothetical protein n=1 Tax=Streptomyces sp. NBC_00452 TaxID=2975746 RepID=UPI0022524FC3|nr:hypothetical protein [Streptomyces sp. NBC_00452]MCX5063809.1 hypothetical protein [Streptomyces sp. NBC_00452]
MPDPTEIAVISSALPAISAFILERVGRLLDSRGAEPEEDVAVPASLVGTLQLPLQPAQDILQNRRAELELLQEALADYTDGTTLIHAADHRLLRNLTRARAALEDIYGQHLTFEGEDRPASGPFVHQKVTTLSGEATGMHSGEITGSSRVIQDVETVDAGGKLIGMKGHRITSQ